MTADEKFSSPQPIWGDNEADLTEATCRVFETQSQGWRLENQYPSPRVGIEPLVYNKERKKGLQAS